MGSFLGGGATTPPPPQKKPANLGGEDLSTNQENVPVPYIAGRQRIAVTWIAPAYSPKAKPVQTETGKGDSQTTGYKYYADMVGAICLGPLDAIYDIIIDNESAFRSAGGRRRNANNPNHVTITNPKKWEQCWVYWGTESQTPGQSNQVLQRRSVTDPQNDGFDPRDPSTWPYNPPEGGATVFDGMAAGDANPLSGHYDQHPDYKGIALIIFKQLYFGEGRNAAPSVEVIVGRGTAYFNNGQLALGANGVNPMGIMFEALAHKRFGGQIPEIELRRAGFDNTRNALAAKSLELSPRVTEATQLREFIGSLLEYYDGFIRANSGQLDPGYFDHGDFPIDNLPLLGSDDLVSEPRTKSSGYGDTVNHVTVRYKNWKRYFKEDVERYTDEANFSIVGQTQADEFQADWIIDATLAARTAFERGKMLSLPAIDGSVEVKRSSVETQNILPGSRIRLQAASFELEIIFRVSEIEWPEDSGGVCVLQIENERTKWPNVFIQEGAPKDDDFVFEAHPIWRPAIIPLPDQLKTNQQGIQVGVLALRPAPQIIGFRVWVSGSQFGPFHLIGTYHQSFMTLGVFRELYPANTQNPDTTVGMLVDLYGFDQEQVVTQTDPERDSARLLVATAHEWLSVGQVNALGAGRYRIYTRRGLFRTPISAQPNGSLCAFIPRSQLLPLGPDALFVPLSTVYFKLQTFTQLAEANLANVPVVPVTLPVMPTLPEPALSPGSTTFVRSIDIDCVNDLALTVRYTADGTDVNAYSLIWPRSGNNFTPLHLTATTCIKARAFDTAGHISPQVTMNYTRLDGGPTCGPVTFGFTGARNQTGGNLTLHCATADSTIHYKKNNGPWLNYSGQFHIDCTRTGDIVRAYASKPGLQNSPISIFDNSRLDPGDVWRTPLPP